jgi:tetratricopeptide (TPR) repeat protein
MRYGIAANLKLKSKVVYMGDPVRQTTLIFSLLASVLTMPCLALEPTGSTGVSMAQQGIDGSKETISKDSVGPTPQTAANNRATWFDHASNSYNLWHQGNVFQAINEGEVATKLNPASTVSLINLALMKQNASKYDEAAALYEQAAKLDPDNWVPPLGISRCYILAGDLANGRKSLRTMSERTNRSFEWYYMTAKTCLEADDLNMAESCATRAMGVARGQEQKSAAENVLLLVLLRANKIEKAKSLQEQVFGHNQPRDPELYVRAVLMLLPASNPAAGKDLLNCAIANLTAVQDSEAFLKLGRVFESKAADPACDDTGRASWLESARVAYSQAIALNPKPGDYHFALAGILCNKGLRADAVEELKKTISLDKMDMICAYLISKILNDETPGQKSSIPLKLSLVRFKIDGLTCACKLSKIQGALRNFKEVVFISTPSQKPFSGVILVDQSVTPAREMLNKAAQDAVSTTTDSKDAMAHISLKMVSEEPVANVDAALKIAREIRFAPVLAFHQTFSEYFNRFKEIAPIMPVKDAGTTSGIQSASNWSAPL